MNLRANIQLQYVRRTPSIGVGLTAALNLNQKVRAPIGVEVL
jgi:hypothetical protein